MMVVVFLDGDVLSVSVLREGLLMGGGAGLIYAGTRARYVDVFAREGMILV